MAFKEIESLDQLEQHALVLLSDATAVCRNANKALATRGGAYVVKLVMTA